MSHALSIVARGKPPGAGSARNTMGSQEVPLLLRLVPPVAARDRLVRSRSMAWVV